MKADGRRPRAAEGTSSRAISPTYVSSQSTAVDESLKGLIPTGVLPVLTERMCERRGEYVSALRNEDGTEMCIISDVCGKDCERKK